MTERRIPIELIDVRNRLRPVDPDRVELLAASFEQIGHNTPILVRPNGERFELVYGAHRLGAASALGWKEIRANVEKLTDHDARLAEIDENLIRSELTEVDLINFLDERKTIYEAKYPETVHGAVGKGRGKVALLKSLEEKDNLESPEWRLYLAPRFSKDVAEKIGWSERTIQRRLSIAKGLRPEVRAALRGTDLQGSQTKLQRLAEVPPEHQLPVIGKITSGDARNISEALVQLKLAPPPPIRDRQFKVLETLKQMWLEANKGTRKKFMAFMDTGEG